MCWNVFISLDTNIQVSALDSTVNSFITSEVQLFDRRISQVVLDPVEFPDINVPTERINNW